MASINTPAPSPEVNSNASAHQPFSWISDEAKDYPLANFVALTLDVCNGINTCLELVNSSNLSREFVQDCNDDVPVLNVCESDYLLRLAIATSQLLKNEAERNVSWINKYAPDKLKKEQAAQNRTNQNAPSKR